MIYRVKCFSPQFADHSRRVL